MQRIKILNIILIITGLVIVIMGLNIGFGGIATLGWLSGTDFVAVTDVQLYAVQDNHIRFIGGLWFVVGAVFIMGGARLRQLRETLVTLCLMIAVAGFFGFSAVDMKLILSVNIAPSMALEIIGFPLLALWLWRTRADK